MSEEIAAKSPSRRVPAAIAALLVLSAGHIALGRYRRAAAWFLVGTLLVALGMVGILTAHVGVMWVGFLLAGLVQVASVPDVLRVNPAQPLPGWGRTVALWVGLLIISKLSSLSVRHQVVESFKIPAASMAPTVLVGDHMFVNKRDRDWKRADIIVFKFPPDPTKDYVKRVVAIAGDTIDLRGDQVFINGMPLVRQHMTGDCQYEDLGEQGRMELHRCDGWTETLDGKTYAVAFDRNRDAPTEPPYHTAQVPPKHVFVLGDNRDNSHDSRYWGFVPVENIKGKASFIYWSSGDNGVRWDRFGKHLQ